MGSVSPIYLTFQSKSLNQSLLPSLCLTSYSVHEKLIHRQMCLTVVTSVPDGPSSPSTVFFTPPNPSPYVNQFKNE